MVVYGHTPVLEPEWLNHTINIDTGCVFGGSLTALRYPENELVSVAAEREYCVPARPLAPAQPLGLRPTAQQAADDLLDAEDVLGKRIIATRLHHSVTIREENSAAALEAMSRFAVDPRWLIFLPPTMSPCETSALPGTLEHPAEAFAYFREHGVARVICEEKHMGSRAVVIVCRDADAARRRFGVQGGRRGVCYTRTGRRFFDDDALEDAVLSALEAGIAAAGLWDELGSTWLCLDCEVMPWSAKAQELLRSQYAATGAAAREALLEVDASFAKAAERSIETEALRAEFRARREAATAYVEAYRRYSWPIASLEDYEVAPFHLLASEGKVHADRDHVWHMETISRVCRARSDGATLGPALVATPYRLVDLSNAVSEADGVGWWDELTSRGGEGMVVKPFDFVARGRKGLIQPAIKCRGREYLRIIYGPDYLLPRNLERLRERGLSTKRSLALREFALGIEGLERFVAREPLRRVHECAFGVLALESEPVDPRL
jgi:protein phosphatase